MAIFLVAPTITETCNYFNNLRKSCDRNALPVMPAAGYNPGVKRVLEESVMKKIAAVACLLLLPVAGPVTAAEPAAPLRVFDAGELALNRYTVVKRLWTGALRASFWIPSYDDTGTAISALTSEARSLGADGVVNLHCLNDRGGWGGGYACYGLAIKLK
jgi:hypothetical protein